MRFWHVWFRERRGGSSWVILGSDWQRKSYIYFPVSLFFSCVCVNLSTITACLCHLLHAFENPSRLLTIVCMSCFLPTHSTSFVLPNWPLAFLSALFSHSFFFLSADGSSRQVSKTVFHLTFPLLCACVPVKWLSTPILPTLVDLCLPPAQRLVS